MNLAGVISWHFPAVESHAGRYEIHSLALRSLDDPNLSILVHVPGVSSKV